MYGSYARCYVQRCCPQVSSNVERRGSSFVQQNQNHESVSIVSPCPLNYLFTRCPLMNELGNCAFVNSDPSVHHTQVEFPTPWQSAFQDIIGLLADGEGAADMFCRMLTAVDEDVISLEIPR